MTNNSSLFSNLFNKQANTGQSLLDYGNYDDVRKHIFNRIYDSVQKSFPLENERYILNVDNLKYRGEDKYDPTEEKKAVLSGGDITRRLTGKYSLIDKKTGDVVDTSGQTTLLNVPYLTDRGEFVRRGIRYVIPKQFRVNPGVYTRVADNGMIEAAYNVRPGTGHNFKIEFDPDKTSFYYKMGNRRIPLVYLLESMGVDSDRIKQTLGKGLYDVNSKIRPSSHARAWVSKLNTPEKQADENEAPNGVLSHFAGMEVNPDTTERTLGKPYKNITPEVLLRSAEKINNIYHNKEDTDDRDSLAYQSIHDFSDMIAEKVSRDQNRVLRNTLWKLTKRGDLKNLPSGVLNKHLDHLFTVSGLAQALEEVNPTDSYNQNMRVVKIGEGGIPTVQQAPLEARAVQPSYANFIDAVKAPESAKVGLDMYMAENVRRGKNDNLLYTQFFNPRTGERDWISTKQATESVIAFPEYFKSDKRYIPAIMNGDKMGYTKKEDIDYVIPTADEMFSSAVNFIPFKSGIKGMRALMGSKFTAQALPLTDNEAPLVDTVIRQENGEDIPMSKLMGKYNGAKFSPVDGKVKAVYKDHITVTDSKGKDHRVSLYNNLPLARKTVLDNIPAVKAGQEINKGELLAPSNFTDDKGLAAPGKNLKVGYTNYKGSTYEDAVVVSEEAANKLQHSALYPVSMDFEPDTVHDLKKYRTLFPSKFKDKQLKKLNDKGVIKVGQKVEYGDPLILGVKEKTPELSSLGRRVSLDETETWDHQEPGIVTDIAETDKGYKVFVRADQKLTPGDKLTIREGGKGVTARVIPNEKMLKDEDGKPLDLLISRLTIPSRTNSAQMIEAALGKVAKKTGKRYEVPGFIDEPLYKYAMDEAKKHNVKINEDLIDPETGKKIPDVFVGNIYTMKTQQTSESKGKARSTGFYTFEGEPGRGGESGSKHTGQLEYEALLAHHSPEVIKDLALVKGQANDEFWREVKSGRIPTVPQTPLVYEKFKDLIKAAGINYDEGGSTDSIFAMTNQQAKDMTGNRKLQNPKTFSKDTLKPLQGGLFSPEETASMDKGDRWSYFEAPEPMLNPVMEDPIKRLLNITGKDFDKIIRGEEEYKGSRGGYALRHMLEDIDLNNEENKVKDIIKNGPKSKKDKAIKKFKVIKSMKEHGVKPEDFMMTRIPVLPPKHRPIKKMKDITLVADLNHLYRELFYAMEDYKDVKDAEVPEDVKNDARKTMYRAYKDVVGTSDPLKPKLKEGNVGGIISQLFGKTSAKSSLVKRKLIEKNVDLAGMGVAAPNPALKLNEVGLPVKQAWDLYEPFIIQHLVRNNVPATTAARAVENRDKTAFNALQTVVKKRPVLINRAPSLHKYSMLALWPRLVKEDTVQVSPQLVEPLNLDYDGDMLSYSVPVTAPAVKEAVEKMMPDKNLLSGRKGQPHFVPSQEYAEGLYYASKEPKVQKPVRFASANEMKQAYNKGLISVDTPVVVG